MLCRGGLPAPTKPMPTIFTHGFVATLLGKSFAVGRLPARFWILSALCSMFADADVLGFPFGIRYEDMLGHRGLSHSLTLRLS
jgi:inner membrane protein